MISVIWSLITGNPIARMLAKIGGLVLLVLTFGAWQRREGAQGQKAKQDEAVAKAVAKGVEAGAKGAAQAEAELRAGKTPQQVKEANDAAWR